MMALFMGGASCGKSQLAEDLCLQLAKPGGPLLYLAAMQPFGEEGARRVAHHRALRAGKGFQTIECYQRFGALAEDARMDGSTALLECLGNVVANEMFGCGDAHAAESDVADRVVHAVSALRDRCANLVVVGNDVGCDGVSYDLGTRRYQEVLGAACCKVAARSDVVVDCAAGCPVVLKGRDLLSQLPAWGVAHAGGSSRRAKMGAAAKAVLA